ncbi:flagellar motor protein MotB [Priestia megaterium]|uniref:flagellar motor protein MotB n=1 Tax=Priestia megaterium TaxID=1404 RepID=UPI0025A438C2|nr:flagellar motor protein MotB [Priestia megaterium]MDM8151442.1 flagellar motor protein MotB [Priestia megaterium]
MSRRRKRKHEEDHVDESWLLPYSDLLTLLLALFIVLFAMSSVDAQKFKNFSRAFNEAFVGGTGVMEFQSLQESEEAVQPSNTPAAKSTEKTNEVETAPNQSPASSQSLTSEQKEQTIREADQEELQQIQSKINAYIQKKNLTNQLQTSLTEEGLLISIRDNVLFDSGRAQVRSEDTKIANDISELLVIDPPRNIIISGHTDNVPIRNAGFESNWELSVMRAVNFMKVILKNDKLNPSMFSAKGFGEFKPVTSNNTAEGQAKNRRVEILITPRTIKQP